LGKSWIWAIVALVLAAGLGACSSSGGRAATSAASSTSAASLTSTVRLSNSSGSLPVYEPSKLVSKAHGFIRLSSADPMSKVISFYDKALKSGRWRIISTTKTATRAIIVAMHGTIGAGITISPAGPAGTSISVLLCTC
jgi:hypothetical protein